MLYYTIAFTSNNMRQQEIFTRRIYQLGLTISQLLCVMNPQSLVDC